MTDRRNGDETDSTPTIFDRSWMERALESSSDPTFVLDTATTEITWANSAAGALVGLERGEVLGHSLAEFVHPDDLIRAAEVLRLADDGIFDDLPITPALYRVRGPDG